MRKGTSRFLELVTCARQSLSAGNFADSEEFARLLLKEFPKSEEGWLILASISKPDEALDHLGKALKVNPDSRAAHQAIQLIANKVINRKQAIPVVKKGWILKDTQPIELHNAKTYDSDHEFEFGGLENMKIETEFQETQTIRDESVAFEDNAIETEPEQKKPGEKTLIEGFLEYQTNLHESNIEKEENDEEKSDAPASSHVSIGPKKVRIIKKIAKPVELYKKESLIEYSMIARPDHHTQRNKLNVDFVELLLITGFSVLLPILIFLYFYFTR